MQVSIANRSITMMDKISHQPSSIMVTQKKRISREEKVGEKSLPLPMIDFGRCVPYPRMAFGKKPPIVQSREEENQGQQGRWQKVCCINSMYIAYK